MEVKIVEPERKEVPPNAQGELCTRGYHVMKGYYKNPDATEKPSMKRAGYIQGILHNG